MDTALRPFAAFSLALALTACHRREPSVAKIDQPGFFAVQSAGQTTLVRSGRRGIRSCLAPRGALRAHGAAPFHKHGTVPRPASDVDYVFFRLCEALGNGDISQQDYVQRIDRLIESLTRAPQPQAAPWQHPPVGRWPHAGPSSGLGPREPMPMPLEQPALLAPWPHPGAAPPPAASGTPPAASSPAPAPSATEGTLRPAAPTTTALPQPPAAPLKPAAPPLRRDLDF